MSQCVWNKITTGFDSCDETANFGTRAMVESHGTIYEANTLATIQPQGKVIHTPHVSGLVHPCGIVCVVIDASLTVFVDESCSKTELNIIFDSPITCFTVSEDGHFLLVGLCGGEVHILDLHNCGKVILSRSVSQAETCNLVNISLQPGLYGTYNAILARCDGQIFRLTNLDLELVSEDCENPEFVNKYAAEVVTSWCDCKVSTASSGLGGSLVLAGNVLRRWGSQFASDDCFFLQDMLIKKVQLLESASVLVCVTEDGKMLLVCSLTMLILRVWDDLRILDFILLEKLSDGEDATILLVTQADEDEPRYLQLVSFPSFTTKYQLKVSGLLYLVAMPPSAKEILFMEGDRSEESGFVQVLKVKTLTESEPHLRFERILRRKKFDEAESFANLFGLSVEEVHKCRTKHYLEQLQPWSDSDMQPSAILDKLIGVLNQINDMQFVCEACLKVTTKDLNHIKVLLRYALDRLKKVSSKHPDRFSALSAQVCNTLFRLETFMVMCDEEDVTQWEQFCQADFLQYVVDLTKKGKLEKATFLWTRHANSFQHLLTDTRVCELLNAVPPDIAASDILPWLSHFIPTVLVASPQSVLHVIVWAVNRTKELEVDVKFWPDNGLDFTRKLSALLNKQLGPPSSTTAVQFTYYERYSCLICGLRTLQTLVNTLEELKCLKETYHVFIPLSDYMQENKQEVVLQILDRTYPDDIVNLVAGFLGQCMAQWRLDADSVISEYISLIASTADWWYSYEEVSWEPTVAALLQCICSTQKLMECSLAALRVAPVPWSNTMNTIAERCLRHDHPLCSEVRHEQKLVLVKLSQKKYGLRSMSNSFVGKRKAIMHIFRQGHKERLKDALDLVSECKKMTEEAFVLFVEHCIDCGDFEQALDVLNDMNRELLLKTCKRILLRTQSCIQNLLGTQCLKNYVDMLGTICTTLQKASCSCFDDFEIQELISNIRNTYNCNAKLAKRINVEHYSQLKTRSAALVDHIRCIANRAEINVDHHIDVEYLHEMYLQVEQVTTILQFSLQEGLIVATRQLLAMKKYTVATSTVGMLADNVMESKKVHKQLYPLANDILELDLETDDRIKMLLQLQNLLSAVCANTLPDELLQWSELLQWASPISGVSLMELEQKNSGLSSLEKEDCLTRWQFTPLYYDPTSHSIDFILKHTRDAFVLCSTYKQALSSDTSEVEKEEVLENTAEDLGLCIDKLCKQDYSLATFSVIRTVHWTIAPLSVSFCHPLSCVITDKKEPLHVLFHKAFVARKVDMKFCLHLLHTVTLTNALSMLKNAGRGLKLDLRKMVLKAELGMIYCAQCGLQTELQAESLLYICCMWAQKLSSFGISVKDMFNNNIQKEHLLRDLLLKVNIDVETVEKFCSSFKIDVQKTLLYYLEVIILKWKPVTEMIESGGKMMAVVKNSERDIIKYCQAIIDQVSNKTTVLHCLSGVWSKINYYYYEMYSAVMELQEYAGKKPDDTHLRTLLFLKTYSRSKLPEQHEVTQWRQIFTDTDIPPLAQYRLPYLPFITSDTRQLIQPELSLATYSIWLKAASIINVKSSLMCIMAIRNSFVSREYQSSEEWLVHSCDDALLDQVKQCISHVSDLEMVTSALYFVMNQSRPGLDQVNAAQLCLSYAKKWVNHEHSPRSEEILEKVATKYLRIQTRHILQCEGLAQPAYLELLSQPERLLEALYQDASIPQRWRGEITHSPDINKVAQQLIQLHGLNATGIILEQLMEWLEPQLADLEDSCNLTAAMQHMNSCLCIDDDNLLRICYVLGGQASETFLLHLLSVAYEVDSETRSVGCRLRALKCLFYVSENDTLERLSGRSISEVRSYMKNLMYLPELESLGFVYSLSEFERIDKFQLVRNIWRKTSHTPRSMMLVACLCLEFQVYDYYMWDILLAKMTKFSMVTELDSLLPQLTNHHHIVNSPAYFKAWYLLIVQPFERANSVLSQEEEAACIHSLQLLQGCPILSHFDLPRLCERCLFLQRPHFAAVILPFLAVDVRGKLLEKIFSQCDKALLNTHLEQLKQSGISTVSQARIILGTVNLQP